MLVIRTAAVADLEPLYELIASSTYGLTTLKISKDQLHERLEESEFAFRRKPKRPAGQPYVFVMEDQAHGKLVGTCAIYSKVGGFEPFYSYRIETTTTSSEALQVTKEVAILHLIKEHDGPTEIGSLYLASDYRGAGNGRLLSLSRFLFIASFPDRFDSEVIAEMRGVVDEQGKSPFWEAIGRHFFDVEFPKAETMTTVSKNFIADLMPKHPIYVTLLPEAAQQTIGKVHPQTEPALALLEKEGFARRGLIDIFDGGPVVHCSRDGIRTVRESRATTIVAIEESVAGETRLISNGREAGFRCCLGSVGERGDEGGVIDRVTALSLGIKVGDSIRHAPLK
ncbi:MAG TPA: arginine N-succinyltransferase [Planctomycetaceae bacterium]|nr:arginine N-succinyltransferase [Planctomycetaceae bacterium]HRF02035.1 arginine N-succinyltransferase [Pirellulaceae bacterium]